MVVTIIFFFLTPSLVSVLIFLENRAFFLVPLPCQIGLILIPDSTTPGFNIFNCLIVNNAIVSHLVLICDMFNYQC